MPGSALKVGFTSWLSSNFSIESTLEQLADGGVEQVEIAGVPSNLEKGVEIGRILKRRSLLATAVSAGVPFWQDPSLNLHSAVEGQRRRSVAYVQRCIDLAEKIGAPLVYVCSLSEGPQGGSEREIELFGESILTCADYGDGNGVKVAVEPFPTGIFPRASETGSIIRKLGSRSLGVLFDTGHALIARESLVDSIKGVSDLLCHVHLSNNDGVSDLHCSLELGRLTRDDFRGLLSELSKVGYTGFVSVELARQEEIQRSVIWSYSYLDELV